MGGVVKWVDNHIVKPVKNTAKDVVDTTKELVKDTYDSIKDGVKKTVDVIVDVTDLTVEVIFGGVFITYDTIIKGESFADSIGKQIKEIGDDLGDVYNSLLDDTLGIDDGKFLGIKGGVFEKLGMLTRDFTNEHATQTVGIAIIVVLIVASILFPPAYGFAGTVALAAFEAGITSTIALMTVYYATLTAVSMGISAVVSGVIDAAILAMYPSLLDSMFLFESQNEALRIAGLTAILTGSVFDRLAGGFLYDSGFAGNIYYDASSPADLSPSVGAEFKITPHAVRNHFGFIDNTMKNQAGDENFSVLKGF